MYASTRVAISSSVDSSRESHRARVRTNAHALGLAAVLTAYLLVCLGSHVARRVGAALVTRSRGLLNEQRRTRRILITAGAFGVAVTLGVSAGGSTLALWNASKSIGAVSLTTGTTGITVNGATSYAVPGLTTTQLLPGLSAVSPQVLTIANTGTTPLSIAVGSPVFSDPSSLLAQNANLVVALFQSTTCAQSVDGSSTAAWTAPVVVAAGASISACLQMTLSGTAPATVQGLSATFTLPLVGTQVRNNP
jgi:hypothetical protein